MARLTLKSIGRRHVSSRVLTGRDYAIVAWRFLLRACNDYAELGVASSFGPRNAKRMRARRDMDASKTFVFSTAAAAAPARAGREDAAGHDRGQADAATAVAITTATDGATAADASLAA